MIIISIEPAPQIQCLWCEYNTEDVVTVTSYDKENDCTYYSSFCPKHLIEYQGESK